MENKNYHRSILVNVTPEKAIAMISQVNQWWKNDFSGNAGQLDGRFKVPFGEHNGEASFVDFVVSEFVPGKKITWTVTDCNLPWFKDKKEWNNTSLEFLVTTENEHTKIDFTHKGLVPGIECYEACEKGWDGHITNGLATFINEGKGIPQ